MTEPGETVATIGVYGSTLESFLNKLHRGGVAQVIDVRQRRGVRGPQYAWANSRRLQAALSADGISYLHRKDLAPTTELRQLQYREDARLGVGKRTRAVLAADYTRRYQQEVLDQADLDSLVGAMPPGSVSALMCVEKDAAACHRSLVAARLHVEHGVIIAHL